MLEMISLGEPLAPLLHHKALRRQFHRQTILPFHICQDLLSTLRRSGGQGEGETSENKGLTPQVPGASLETERQAVPTVELSQHEMKFEEYTAKVFQRTEISDDRIRHVAIRFMVNKCGVQLDTQSVNFVFVCHYCETIATNQL